jgi:hypothetical protein
MASTSCLLLGYFNQSYDLRGLRLFMQKFSVAAESKDNGLLSNYPLGIQLVALLFLFKAILLAFWVTPLDFIPDELAHFAYIQDMVEGNGVPVLGQATIPTDLWNNQKGGDSDPQQNWIAQHPPFYHGMAAILLKLTAPLLDTDEIYYRLPRLISACSGGLLILVLYKTFLLLGLDPLRSTALAASMGFIPMLSHLSSGTNHDVTLFLVSAIASYYFVYFQRDKKLKHAYLCALWLAITAATKMTAWIFLGCVLIVIVIEISGTIVERIRHTFLISILAMSTSLAWIIRSLYLFGDPFKTHGTRGIGGFSEALGIIDYISRNTVFEHFFLHFYGLIGWRGRRMMMQIEHAPREFFTVIIFGLCILLSLYVLYVSLCAWRSQIKLSSNSSIIDLFNNQINKLNLRKLFLLAGLFASVGLATATYLISHRHPTITGDLRIGVVSISIFLGCFSLFLVFLAKTFHEKIALYALGIFFIFGVILLFQVYGAYLNHGWLRALHGRYFYPFIPFLLAAVAVMLVRFRIPAIVVCLVAILMALLELEAFLTQVIPFYYSRID